VKRPSYYAVRSGNAWQFLVFDICRGRLTGGVEGKAQPLMFTTIESAENAIKRTVKAGDSRQFEIVQFQAVNVFKVLA
jgi:hypothetical protein